MLHGSASSESFRGAQLQLLLTVVLSSAVAFAQAQKFQPRPDAGPGTVIVHSKYGGQIFGFDVDQNGTEGVLTEAGGSVQAAVETFDQRTGRIIRVLEQTTNDGDDYLGLGVVGTSVGLIEKEHVVSFLHVQRT